jgi:hypothetical protein
MTRLIEAWQFFSLLRSQRRAPVPGRPSALSRFDSRGRYQAELPREPLRGVGKASSIGSNLFVQAAEEIGVHRRDLEGDSPG